MSFEGAVAAFCVLYFMCVRVRGTVITILHLILLVTHSGMGQAVLGRITANSCKHNLTSP